LIDCRPDDGDYEKEFVAQYRREFGFILSSRKLIVEDVRVRAIGKGKNIEQQAIEEAATPDCEPTSHAKYVFERQRERERESERAMVMVSLLIQASTGAIGVQSWAGKTHQCSC
jgi:N-methylhydantoinase A/oxoprolinase/acetone carboxylase beta subunit